MDKELSHRDLSSEGAPMERDVKTALENLVKVLKGIGGLFEEPENVMRGWPTYIGLETGEEICKALIQAKFALIAASESPSFRGSENETEILSELSPREMEIYCKGKWMAYATMEGRVGALEAKRAES